MLLGFNTPKLFNTPTVKNWQPIKDLKYFSNNYFTTESIHTQVFAMESKFDRKAF